MIDLNIMSEIAKQLSDNNIIWGIGGSYLLQIYGIYNNPNDLDLWVKPSDMDKVKQIFCDYQRIKTTIQLPEQFHLKILYKDVEVEFVACFYIQPNQNKYIYNIAPQNIRIIELEGGLKVPCTYLEDWYVVYKLLKRQDKAELIAQFFRSRGLSLCDSVLKNALKDPENKIPKYISNEVYQMIWDTFHTQLSVDDFLYGEIDDEH